MSIPTITMRELLQAGVHFGHRTRYWEPKMAPYIFGVRQGLHIINLEETLPKLKSALSFVEKTASNRGKILFVGTKYAATRIIQEQALRCGMPYVNCRWLGGMLTNYKTIRKSIKRLVDLEEKMDTGYLDKLTKREGLFLSREKSKLERSFAGIKNMGGLPDLIYLVDVNQEKIALKEAVKLGIPVIGIVDTNNSPEGIQYPIPGNDDAMSAIQLYTKALADTIIATLKRVNPLDIKQASGKKQTVTVKKVTGIKKKVVTKKPTDRGKSSDKQATVAVKSSSPQEPTSVKTQSKKTETKQDKSMKTISSEKIKTLRQRSGVGILECKKALEEANGDLDLAFDVLRKLGQAKADKRSNYATREGTICFKINEEKNVAAILEINCETDFVTRGDDFKSFSDQISGCLLREKVTTLAALNKKLMNPEGSETVEQMRQSLIAKTGENIQISRFKRLDAKGRWFAYSHGGRIGVLVDMSGGDDSVGQNIAMHIAASQPFVVSSEELSEDLLNKEKEIFMAQFKDSDKPESMRDNIIQGKLQKFKKAMSLLGQAYVKDTRQTVADVLTAAGATVHTFVRFELGETSKQTSDVEA